jgi:hypothetical protein
MIHQLNSSINSSLHAYASLIKEEEKQDTVKTHCRVECRQIPSTELRRDLLVNNNNKYFEKFLKVFGEHLNMSVLITRSDIIRWLWLLSGKANKPHDQSV